MKEKEVKQVRRPMTKKERIIAYTNYAKKWKSEGLTDEQIAEKFTPKQWDFICEENLDIASMLLTPEQTKAITELRKTPRPVFENGYKKKYPQDKQTLFNGLVEWLKDSGATDVSLPEKVNYRDVSFTVNGTRYALVLSMPRQKKEE